MNHCLGVTTDCLLGADFSTVFYLVKLTRYSCCVLIRYELDKECRKSRDKNAMM